MQRNYSQIKRRGFTLIEILIVITIIAILAMIIVPAFMGTATKSRAASMLGNLHTMREAIEHFVPTPASIRNRSPTSSSLTAIHSRGIMARIRQL